MKTKDIVFTAPKIAELQERDVKEASNNTVAHFPRTCGYSSAGVVEAVGENVTTVAVGDRVSLSWSKHSQYCVVPECNVHKILSEDKGQNVGTVVLTVE